MKKVSDKAFVLTYHRLQVVLRSVFLICSGIALAMTESLSQGNQQSNV